MNRNKIFYGWWVVLSSSLVVFGVAGANFSFGGFLKPMLEDFPKWHRGMLATAFGTTFMLTGILRPLAGYLTDRYSPKAVALSGVVIVAVMMFCLPYVQNLYHLFLIFGVMSLGFTFSMGPTLTKIVSSWFYRARGVTLGFVNGGGSVGGMVLVPMASALVVWTTWQDAYRFLGVLLILIVLPVGLLLIKNKPEDVGLQPEGERIQPDGGRDALSSSVSNVYQDATVKEAFGTPFFWKLTAGYFV